MSIDTKDSTLDDVPTFSTLQILEKLKLYHDPKDWAFFDELRIGTGYGKDSEQRFDAWAIHYHPSKRNVTRCYEIKISRSDFRSEIKKPLKRRPGLRLSNEFYFVAPKGLIHKEEVPPECGLIEVGESGKLNVAISAPFRDVMPPTWLFLASISRRVDKSNLILSKLKTKIDFVESVTGSAANQIIEKYIQKWREFNSGSREIPDRILQELVDLKKEMSDLLAHQRSDISGILDDTR